MRCLVGMVMVWGLSLGTVLSSADRAGAEIIVAIDKSKQRMTVVVDGAEQHVWKVSTGTGGGPKSGTYRPERLERKWFSRKYGMSPMPHSIFFHEGYAIHGTIYVSRLGNRASHGCVRLHPKNAAALFDLVRSRGMGDTTIVVSNSEYVLKRNDRPNAEASIPKALMPKALMPNTFNAERSNTDASMRAPEAASDVPAAHVTGDAPVEIKSILKPNQ